MYLHIEVQGPGGEYFPYRMFSYCCLIVSHYHEVLVALAVLTAPRPVAERGSLASYEAGSYGTRLSYQYNCLELYALDDEELLSSENPVDLAFYAAKKAAGCQDRERQKLRYLRELTRILAAKGWDEEARREVFTFVARVINLKDPELRGQYLEELEAEKEATKMESFVEKYFLDKGRSEGRNEGRSQGRSEGFLETLRNLMETTKWSASEAMAAMKIPQAERARYAAML